MYTSVAINLPSHQWEWLEQMTVKHNLKSISKAVRICVTCVAVGDAALPNHASASPIAQQQEPNDRQERPIELSSQQLDYIQRTNRGTIFETVEQIVDACRYNVDECTVFGVVRCKSSIDKCEGARDAVIDIGKRYDRKCEEVTADAKENIVI